MASTFKIEMTFERVVTYFIEAETEDTVRDFLSNNPDWRPHDIQGLIDLVSDEEEVGVEVFYEDKITAGYRINGAGHLEEIDT